MLSATLPEAPNAAFSEIVRSLGEFKTSFKTMTLPQRISALSAAKMEDGMGTALLITSGSSIDAENRESFEKLFEFDITVERVCDAIVRGVDWKSIQLPNWDRTAGATLPSWSDESSRGELVNVLIKQVISNGMALSAITKSANPSVAEKVDAIHRLAASRFIVGLIQGLIHSKKKDLEKMEYQMQGGKTPVIALINRIQGILDKANAEGLVVRAIESR